MDTKRARESTLKNVLAAAEGLVGLPAVADSGQRLNCEADKTDYNVTVVAGGKYSVSADNGRILLGVAAVAAGAAIVDPKVIWPVVHAGAVEIITIPAGVTALHYATDSGAAVTGRIARVQ